MMARAMSDVRSSDRATRQLMQIDIAAKQLALQIAAYEDMVGGQDDQSQQVMGDESGA